MYYLLLFQVYMTVNHFAWIFSNKRMTWVGLNHDGTDGMDMENMTGRTWQMGLALGHDLLTLTLKPAHNHNPNYNNVTYFHVLQTRIRTYDRSRPRVILKSAISAYSAIDRYQAPLPTLNRVYYDNWGGVSPLHGLHPPDRTPGPSDVISASLDRAARLYSPYRAPCRAWYRPIALYALIALITLFRTTV